MIAPVLKFIIGNWLGVASLFLAICSVGIAIYIAIRQNLQLNQLKEISANIDDNVLGTLKGFEHVLERLEKMLKDADKDPESRVYFMAYWLWFGADEAFPAQKISTIDVDTSHISLLLRARIASNRPTTLVIYEDEASISAFIQELFEYKVAKEKHSHMFSETELEGLIERYMEEVKWIKRECEKHDNIQINFIKDIPAIMFAKDGHEGMAGIYYIGETAMLRERTELGGFSSKSTITVKMLIAQINNFASHKRQRTNLGFSQTKRLRWFTPK